MIARPGSIQNPYDDMNLWFYGNKWPWLLRDQLERALVVLVPFTISLITGCLSMSSGQVHSA